MGFSKDSDESEKGSVRGAVECSDWTDSEGADVGFQEVGVTSDVRELHERHKTNMK